MIMTARPIAFLLIAHQLWLLASGKPSPLLPDWLTDPAAAAARTAQVRAAE